MDKLKALVAAKRKATDEEFGGRKYVKRGELEEMRLKKLREEEEEDRLRKGGGAKEGSAAAASAAAAPSGAAPARPAAKRAEAPVPLAKPLPKEEVIRRLRVLREPATLFGESDEARQQRLLHAEQNVQVDDETAGGQQSNFYLEHTRRAKKPVDKDKDKAAAASKAGKAAAAAGRAQPGGGGVGGEGGVGGGGDVQLAVLDSEQQKLMDSFKAAAEAVAEAQLPVEDRISRQLKRWMADWEEDLEGRSEEVKATGQGHQASVRYAETVQYLRPLHARLKHRGVEPEMLAGIKLIVDAMKDRNYLHAYKIYMGLAVGNSPWPIGVTQVGLHERSAREKISFKSSMSTAHIMNDEATRKFIQALKRLMTFCQRRYPTAPSRSVDFDGGAGGAGRGAMGGGSDKLALLEALAAGDSVAPAPAPSHVDRSGAIKIPAKWDHLIRGALAEVVASGDKEEAEEREEAARKEARGKAKAGEAAASAAAAGGGAAKVT